MRIVTSVATMQRLAMEWNRRGVPVGLVPTMGYLHGGHASLVRKARQRAGQRGVVVVSIYVNPTQFAPTEDLANYPRDLPRDKKLCRDAGVDGVSRPTHFRGVATVVAKLFNIVRPEVAVFGAKDFQQAAIVKRMARDLNFPVKIIVAPTVREADGLALSSRNKYLSAEERAQAVALWQAIQQARQTVRTSTEPIPASRLNSELKWLIETRPAARVDYIEFFDPDTFQPVAKVQRGAQIALAVFVGKTRLIDNARI